MEKQLIPNLRFPEFCDSYNNYVLNDALDLLTDFESNGSFASVKENVNIYEKKNYAWYVRATDLENDSGLDKVKYVDEHSYKFLKKTPLFGNELLITKRGEIGKVYFFKPEVNIKATVAPNMYLLKLNNLVEPKYVYYYFKNDKGNKKLKRINASTTIGALYKDDVKSIKVNLPSLPEQQKIASFLTDVDNKITKLTKKKDLLEQYKKGIMQKIFSQELRFKDDNGNAFPKWEEKKLGEVATFFSGGTPTSTNRSYYSGDIPFIGSGNISDDKVEKYITEEAISNSSAKMVEKGDILYALYGATSGEVSISKINGAINQAVLCIRTTNNNYFIFQYLLMQKPKIISTYLQGGQGNLSANIIKELKVKFPCLDEQTKIANFLSDIDEKIEALNAKIENSKTFKKGLLQQMFV